MALETRASVFAQAVVDALEAAGTPVDENTPPDLNITGVSYGDQNRIPTDRYVCVEPANTVRELNGVPRKTRNVIEILVIVYLTKIQSVQANRKESDELIEDIQDLLHQDPTMGGKCIHSMVTRVESGYSTKDNAVLRAARLTFEITTQELLPQ